jgi:hypothetical protein
MGLLTPQANILWIGFFSNVPTHGQYLVKATCKNCHDSSKKQDFELSSLPLTLKSYLARENSPIKILPHQPTHFRKDLPINILAHIQTVDHFDPMSKRFKKSDTKRPFRWLEYDYLPHWNFYL